jgi:dTDP-L-rhamnose 4-epimerase
MRVLVTGGAGFIGSRVVEALVSAGAGRLVLASSMVVYGEGAHSCAEHGLAAAPAGRVPA